MEEFCSIDGCAKLVKARGWCDTHYQRWWKHGDPVFTRPVYGRCQVPGCELEPRSRHADLCEMHYGRRRRNGHFQRQEWPIGFKRVVHGRGYIRLHNIDHPLADRARTVFEHRAVAYNDRGGADPSCEWCGLELDWATADVDHIDDDPGNNQPSNLVISCHQCNSARGQCGARRFAEGVAVRVLCREYGVERADIVERVMEKWEARGGRLTDDDFGFDRVIINVFASHADPRGPRGVT